MIPVGPKIKSGFILRRLYLGGADERTTKMQSIKMMNRFSGEMKRSLVLAVLFLAVFPVLLPAQGSEKFEEANTSYRTGDFQKAAQLYEELAGEAPANAVYQYNLGNACVRTGELSKAVLSFERALLIEPRNKDIRQNLAHARSLLEYRVDDNRNWYLKTVEAVLSRFTQREMVFAAQFFLFVFFLSAAAYFLMKQPVFWGMGRRVLIFFVLISAVLAGAKHVQVSMIRPSIVMAKECDARYGPSEHDQVAFRMGEGLKVFIMDRRKGWSRVLLTNGESGWVRNDDIGEVRI